MISPLKHKTGSQNKEKDNQELIWYFAERRSEDWIIFTGHPDASGWCGRPLWQPALCGGALRQGDEQLLQQVAHRPRLLRHHLHHLRPLWLHSSQRCAFFWIIRQILLEMSSNPPTNLKSFDQCGDGPSTTTRSSTRTSSPNCSTLSTISLSPAQSTPQSWSLTRGDLRLFHYSTIIPPFRSISLGVWWDKRQWKSNSGLILQKMHWSRAGLLYNHPVGWLVGWVSPCRKWLLTAP